MRLYLYSKFIVFVCVPLYRVLNSSTHLITVKKGASINISYRRRGENENVADMPNCGGVVVVSVIFNEGK